MQMHYEQRESSNTLSHSSCSTWRIRYPLLWIWPHTPKPSTGRTPFPKTHQIHYKIRTRLSKEKNTKVEGDKRKKKKKNAIILTRFLYFLLLFFFSRQSFWDTFSLIKNILLPCDIQFHYLLMRFILSEYSISRRSLF